MLNKSINLKIVSWVLFVMVSILFIIKMVAQPYRLSGDCMEPAIVNGRLYFVNKVLPYFRQYRIGDIIVFKHEAKDWIARIVALEGDTIAINESSILVNGAQLGDNVVRNWTDWKYGTYAVDNSIKVPSNCVYVLSDNLSAHHDDSRVFGPISKSVILGVIW